MLRIISSREVHGALMVPISIRKAKDSKFETEKIFDYTSTPNA